MFWLEKDISKVDPLDTGRKLNVHKTFRGRPGRLMYVQFTSCVYWEKHIVLINFAEFLGKIRRFRE